MKDGKSGVWLVKFSVNQIDGAYTDESDAQKRAEVIGGVVRFLPVLERYEKGKGATR